MIALALAVLVWSGGRAQAAERIEVQVVEGRLRADLAVRDATSRYEEGVEEIRLVGSERRADVVFCVR